MRKQAVIISVFSMRTTEFKMKQPSEQLTVPVLHAPEKLSCQSLYGKKNFDTYTLCTMAEMEIKKLLFIHRPDSHQTQHARIV